MTIGTGGLGEQQYLRNRSTGGHNTTCDLEPHDNRNGWTWGTRVFEELEYLRAQHYL